MIAPRLDDDDVPAVTYDLNDASVVVIVGSGAGGGTVADELTRRGIDVVRARSRPPLQDERPRQRRVGDVRPLHLEGQARLHRRLAHRPRLSHGADLDLQGVGRLHPPLGGHVPAPAALRVQGAHDLRRGRRRGPGGLAARLRRDGALLPPGREQDGRHRAGRHPASTGLQQLPGHGARRAAHGLPRLRPQQSGDQRGAPRRPQCLRPDRLLYAGLQVRRQMVHLRLRAAPRRGDRPLRDTHARHGAPHRA